MCAPQAAGADGIKVLLLRLLLLVLVILLCAYPVAAHFSKVPSKVTFVALKGNQRECPDSLERDSPLKTFMAPVGEAISNL